MFTLSVVNHVVDEEIIRNFVIFLSLSVIIIFCIKIMVPAGPWALCTTVGVEWKVVPTPFLLCP